MISHRQDIDCWITLVQEGCLVMLFSLEQFNEQAVLS